MPKKTKKTSWWETQFGDQYLTTYERKIPHRQTEVEINFIIQKLKLVKHDSILDLGCGYGRHSIALSKKGYNVTGIDFSPELIHRAKLLTRNLKFKPIFIQGDMRKIKYKEKFSVILSLFTSFGYFNHTDNILSLKKIYAALSQNGRLILDVINTEKYVSDIKRDGIQLRPGVFTRTNEHHEGTLHFYNTNTYHEKNFISHLNRSWSMEGKKGTYNFYIKRYPLKMLISMLEEIGFCVDQVWGEFEDTPWSSNTGRSILIATKTEKSNSKDDILFNCIRYIKKLFS